MAFPTWDEILRKVEAEQKKRPREALRATAHRYPYQIVNANGKAVAGAASIRDAFSILFGLEREYGINMAEHAIRFGREGIF